MSSRGGGLLAPGLAGLSLAGLSLAGLVLVAAGCPGSPAAAPTPTPEVPAAASPAAPSPREPAATAPVGSSAALLELARKLARLDTLAPDAVEKALGARLERVSEHGGVERSRLAPLPAPLATAELEWCPGDSARSRLTLEVARGAVWSRASAEAALGAPTTILGHAGEDEAPRAVLSYGTALGTLYVSGEGGEALSLELVPSRK